VRRTAVSLLVTIAGLTVALFALGASPAAGSVLIGSDLSATPNFGVAFGSGTNTFMQSVASSSGVAAGGLTAPSDGIR
jgi:hypothetical protein